MRYDCLNLDASKIRVIYPGIPDTFFHSNSRGRQAEIRPSQAFRSFCRDDRASKECRYPAGRMVAVARSYRQGQYELIFVGPIGWAGNETVRSAASGIDGVRVLGYVPEADLPSITAAAYVFAYPSFYEGFGFPIAQAMAAGVPVITSNISSMPEVVGDSGVLVDPHSSQEIASALQLLLTSANLRERLGIRGRELARRFTWKNSAEAVRRVLFPFGLKTQIQLIADDAAARLEKFGIEEASGKRGLYGEAIVPSRWPNELTL